MATSPAFASTPKRGGCVWLNGTTANTRSDGNGTIGTDILLAYTAGSSGAFIDRVRLVPVSLTSGSLTSTATVARIYVSTATSGATTSTNTKLWHEVACPSQAGFNTGTVASTPVDIPMGIRIAANETILFSMYHVAAANTGWECTVIASDY